ncbi:MAG: YqjF family protein [Janthinobacterium lividum]
MPFTFLTAEWRKLLMAQFEIDPAILASRLPAGLELDLYDGRCFVSLIGFLFDRVRILGVPVPFHTRFEEVNLRFYVRRRMPDGTSRRGVVFLSEVVPKPAITLVARTLYGEAYTTAPTTHHWSSQGPHAHAVRHGELPLEIEYEWKPKQQWQRLAVRAGNVKQPMLPGSLEEFITEHYWGYTPRRGGGTAEYAVQHRRWEVYPIQSHRIACDFGSLFGADFAHLTGRDPDHILLAEGAPVSIGWGGNIA